MTFSVKTHALGVLVDHVTVSVWKEVHLKQPPAQEKKVRLHRRGSKCTHSLSKYMRLHFFFCPTEPTFSKHFLLPGIPLPTLPEVRKKKIESHIQPKYKKKTQNAKIQQCSINKNALSACSNAG